MFSQEKHASQRARNITESSNRHDEADIFDRQYRQQGEKG